MRKTIKRMAVLLLTIAVLMSCMVTLPASAAFWNPWKDKSSHEESWDDESWVGAWSTSPVEFNWKEMLNLGCIKKEYGIRNLTFRTRIQPTLSGSAVRITLSNEYGTGPLTVNSVTIARGYERLPQAIQTWTKQTVKFNGSSQVTIPAGETVTSDPIQMSVEALEYLTVSMYFKESANMKTYGLIGGDTYIMSGDFAGAATTLGVPMRMNGDFGEYAVIPALTGLEVYAPGASSVVLLGDSTLANDIPLMLAERLQDAGIDNVGILQQAIKGNRLLDDGAGLLGMVYGESVMDRFERDALDQPGVSKIFIKVGANDIIHPNCESMKGEARPVTTEEMIEGYEQLIDVAHERGIQVYLFTRSAWKGYTRNLLGLKDDIQWTPELDRMRQEINDWILSKNNPADGVIDLDFMCQDSNEATQLCDEYTTDGVHFTAQGQQVLVDAIPLEFFE